MIEQPVGVLKPEQEPEKAPTLQEPKELPELDGQLDLSGVFPDELPASRAANPSTQPVPDFLGAIGTGFAQQMTLGATKDPKKWAQAVKDSKNLGMPALDIYENPDLAKDLKLSRKAEEFATKYRKAATAIEQVGIDGNVLTQTQLDHIAKMQDRIDRPTSDERNPWENFTDMLAGAVGRQQQGSSAIDVMTAESVARNAESGRLDASGASVLNERYAKERQRRAGMTPEELQGLEPVPDDVVPTADQLSQNAATSATWRAKETEAIDELILNTNAVDLIPKEQYSESLQELQAGGMGGFEAALTAMADEPSSFLRFMGGMGVESLPTMLATAVNRGAGFMVGAQHEKGAALIELLSEQAGGQLTPSNVRAMLSDPEMVAEINRKATVRGIIVGAIDTGAQAIAGVPLGVGTGITGTMTNIGAQTAVQGVAGAGGYALGQVATGDEIDTAEMTLEALGEAVFAAPEVAIESGRATFRKAMFGATRIRQQKQASQNQDGLVDVALNTELRTESPETYNAILAGQLKGSSQEMVWIPASSLQTLNQTNPNITELMGQVEGMPAAYADALARGGSVQIPNAAYLTYFADFHEDLKKDIRQKPDGFSENDSAIWSEEEDARIEQMVENMKTNLSEGGLFFRDTVSELMSAGRSRTEAEAVAQLHTNVLGQLSSKMGVSYAEAARLFKLNIGREMPKTAVGRTVSDMTIMLDRLRAGDVPKVQDQFGMSLGEWVISKGGLDDAGGELDAIDADVGKVGKNRYAKAGGMSIDQAAREAVDAGYFPNTKPEDITPQMIVDAIGMEIAGKPKYSVSSGNEELQKVAQGLTELSDYLGQSGIDLDQLTNEEVIAALTGGFVAGKDAGTEEKAAVRILNQFAGTTSLTKDGEMFAKAEQALKAGADAEAVRKLTGWFKGLDGMWRYEISDLGAELDYAAIEKLKSLPAQKRKISSLSAVYNGNGTVTVVLKPVKDPVRDPYGSDITVHDVHYDDIYGIFGLMLGDKIHKSLDTGNKTLTQGLEYEGADSVPLATVLHHPKLFAAYPQAHNIRFSVDEGMKDGGSMSTIGNTIVITVGSEKQLSTMLHEIQHAIQRYENFATGGNPTAIGYYQKSMSDQISALAAIDRQRRDALVGEASELANELFDRMTPDQRQALYSAKEVAKGISRGGDPDLIAITALEGGYILDNDNLEGMGISRLEYEQLIKLSDAAITENPEITEKRQKLQEFMRLTPHEAYMRLAGEMESRLVEARMDMDDEQRAATEIQYDRKPEHAIVARGATVTMKDPIASDLMFRDWFDGSIVVDNYGNPQVHYHGSYQDFDAFDRMWSANVRQTSMDTVGSWFSDRADMDGAGMYVPTGSGAAIYPVYLSIKRPKVYFTFDEFLSDMHAANGNRLEDMNPKGVGSPEALRERLKAQGYDAIAFTRTDVQELIDEAEKFKAAWDQTIQDTRDWMNSLPEGYEPKKDEWLPYQKLEDKARDAWLAAEEAVNEVGRSTEFDKQIVWVAFEPTQIKSIFNQGTWSKTDPRILNQSMPSGKKPDFKQLKQEKASGRYVGAPDNIGDSLPALKKLYAKLKGMAIEGESGRYWYEQSSRAVMDMVGGNKELAEKFVGLLAIYSQGTEVGVNTGFAIEAMLQWMSGRPIKTGRFPTEQTKKANAWLLENRDWGGIKTNNFYVDLMEEIAPEQFDESHATMDMWMAIAFDYGKKTLDQGPQYNFAKTVTEMIAADLGWKPHQVQAAIWSSIKTRFESIRGEADKAERKNGIQVMGEDGNWKRTDDKAHFRLAHQMAMKAPVTPEIIRDAAYDFSHALRERMVSVMWEATPSKDEGSIQGIHDAPTSQKMEYLAAVNRALTGQNGEDLIAEAVGMPTFQTRFGTSAWQGETGAGAATDMILPVKGTGKARALAEFSNDDLELYASMKALVLRQDAIIWSNPYFDASNKSRNGVDIIIPTEVTEEYISQFYAILHAKFGTWDIAPAFIPNGVRVLNFVDGLSNTDFQKGIAEIMADMDLEGNVDLRPFASIGGIVSNDWKENPDGNNYSDTLRAKRPDLLARADQLRAGIETINREFIEAYGWDRPRPAEERGLRNTGGVRGGSRVLEQSVRPDQSNGGQPSAEKGRQPDGSLQGLPRNVAGFVASSWEPAQQVARDYMAEAGLEYSPPSQYVKADPERGARIAAAFEEMQHNPQDPATKAAYAALIKETTAQYAAVLKTGLQVEFIAEGQQDPYEGNPRAMTEDVRNNNHMWVFSTRDGFGSSDLDVNDNPLLGETDFQISGQTALANDLFRVVHDYFGHVKEGVGFRADGEENTWQAHAAMFSPLARKALTTETRGQNSWVNFGPNGETNRTAGPADTIYADQKVGLLPDWVVDEGRMNSDGPAIRSLNQELGEDVRGNIAFTERNAAGVREFQITLGRKSDPSTVLHEMAHYYLEVITDIPAMAEDLQIIRDWVGNDGGVWTTEQHEKFARGFEAYLREGKAPSVELAGAFSKFKAWLMRVYTSVSQLDVELSDEVRAFFDRMVASEAEIDYARSASGNEPMFESAEKAGMTPEEWAAYIGSVAYAKDTAENQVFKEVAREEARKRSKWWAETKAAMVVRITEEIELQPVYQAQALLRSGPLKLNSTELRDLYGKGAVKRLAMMYSKNALPMDIVARQLNLGYTSADHLVKDLLAAPNKRELINSMADQQMAAQHGAMNDTEAADRAMDAVHNERQADVLAIELMAIARSVGAKNSSAKIAREVAKRTIARTKVRDLVPAEFQRAEAKSAREAYKALVAGDKGLALQHKQQQLLNFWLWKESLIARQRADDIVQHMKKYNKKAVRQKLGKAGSIYLQQIDSVMEQYEFKKVSNRQLDRRASHEAWYESQIAQGLDPYVPEYMIKNMDRVNYRELTSTELDELKQFTDNVAHFAKLKNTLLSNQKIRNREDAIAELVAAAKDNMKKQDLPSIDPNNAGITKGMFDWLKSANSSLMKIEQLIDWLDGGDSNGAWSTLIWQPLADAQAKRDRITHEVTMKILGAVDSWRADRKGQGAAIWIPEINDSLTPNAILATALNVGNAGNRKKLMKGRGWSETQLQAVLVHMEPADWHLVKSLWETASSLWPQIVELEMQVNGIPPVKVEGIPVNTPIGVITGDYWPLVYDFNSDEYIKLRQNMGKASPIQANGNVSATMPNGYTKARSEEFAAPILLDAGIISHHMNGVILDLTHRVAIRETLSLLAEPEISSALRATIGDGGRQQMVGVIEGIANDLAGDTQAISRWSRLFQKMMSNTAIAWMGFSVTTVLNQVSGYSQAMDYFMEKKQTRYFGRAMVQFIKDPIANRKRVAEMSEEMAFRSHNLDVNMRQASQMMLDLPRGDSGDIVRFGNKHLKAMQKYAFMPLQLIQSMVDTPVWMAAYEAEGGVSNHAEAVQAGDRAVRLSQMAGGAKDLAVVQQNAMMKLFLVVYSYSSLLWNRNVNLAKGAASAETAQEFGTLAIRFIMLNTFPALLAGFIKGQWPDEDEDESFLAYAAIQSLLSVTSGIPLFRDFMSGLASPFGYGGSTSVGQQFEDLSKLFNARTTETVLPAIMTVLGSMFGLPSVQVNRAMKTMLNEDIEAEVSLEFIQALLMGPPKK